MRKAANAPAFRMLSASIATRVRRAPSTSQVAKAARIALAIRPALCRTQTVNSISNAIGSTAAAAARRDEAAERVPSAKVRRANDDGGKMCGERFADLHWGDPTKDACQRCQCDEYGAESQQCDRRTGQCICRPGSGGTKCDRCAKGFYEIKVRVNVIITIQKKKRGKVNTHRK